MSLRRTLSLFALSLACCVVDAGADRAPRTEARSERSEPTARLEFVEKLTGDARPGDRVPAVVAIHGLGDTPESFARVFDSLGAPARLICPRAPLPHHGGFAWTRHRVRGGDEAALEADLAERVSELAQLLERLAERPEVEGPFVVTGFSQGGMLTYALTLAHPELVRAAFPIGGTLPRRARESPPRPPQSAPRILAFHGDADTTVPYAHDRALVEALRTRSWDASLHTAEGVGHSVPPAMRRAVHRAIEASLSK